MRRSRKTTLLSLALVEVQGMMPLENKLPEPYRSVWKEVITSKKNKETKDGKKSGVTEGAKKEAPTQAPAVPRKLPPAPKDFMFSEDKEEEEEPPEIFSVAPGTLDPTTADWLCVGCNTQNYARLATGQLRTKCFKCGGTKSDACELVQSTQPAKVDKQPAALKNLQSAFGKAQREEEKERLEEKKARTKPHAFKGSHTGAAQLVQRGGRGNRQKKGGNSGGGAGSGNSAGPVAVMDLQARDSKAVEARAREEYLLMKRKRTAYFDAVKRANRPSTVTINPALRTQLEHALGINDVEGALSGGLGAELGDVPGDINSYLSYLLQLQQEREDEEEEIYYLPVISSRAKIQTQRDALRGTVQSLLDMGFLESQVILAVETVRREQQDRLLDDMDDYNGLDFVGKLLDCVKSSVLEWLCLHLAEEDLPEGLDLDSNMTNPGISVAPSPFSNSLRDMSRSSSKDTLTLEVNEEVNVGNNTRASNKSGSNSNNKAVTELCKYGWAQEDILSALELCKRATSEYTESSPPDNPSWALLLQVKTMLRNATLAAIEKEDTASSRVSLNLSLSLGVDQMQHKSHAEQGDSSDAGVSIEEECMVLESIFTPENFAVKDYSDGVRHICVNIPVDLLKTSSKRSLTCTWMCTCTPP